MGIEAARLPIGQKVALPGHFDQAVTLEGVRPLGKGFECRVRLADGSLDETVISEEEAQILLGGVGVAEPTSTIPADADQVRLLVESTRIRVAYSLVGASMCCQFSNGVSIPILCPLALPNRALGLESQIGSWLASYLKPTFLLAQLHEPRASNHHRCMKPRKQCPQLACSRSGSTRRAHSPGAIEVGLDASQTDSHDRGVGGGLFLDLHSHRIKANDYTDK